MMKWVTTDRIIAIGLVVSLVASLVLGGSVELQTTIAAGLIGYLSKEQIAHQKDDKPKEAADRGDM